jgi:hypothetical protein
MYSTSTLCPLCPCHWARNREVVLYTELYLQPFIKTHCANSRTCESMSIRENVKRANILSRKRTLSRRKQTLSRRMRTFLLNDHHIIEEWTDVFYSNTFIVYDIVIPYGAKNKLFYFFIFIYYIRRWDASCTPSALTRSSGSPPSTVWSGASYSYEYVVDELNRTFSIIKMFRLYLHFCRKHFEKVDFIKNFFLAKTFENKCSFWSTICLL